VVQGHDQLDEGSKTFPEYLEYLAGRVAVVDQEDHRGSTPLMDACQCQNPELIQTLLDLGADINWKGHMGRTPIFYACEKPDNGSLDLLLKRGADVTVTMTGGSTPLHVVCSWGVISNVQLLLKYNAPITALDGDGNTPLRKAADNKAVDIMLELVKTREYFPKNPAADPAFIEPPKSAAKIVGVFLNSFDVEDRDYSDRDLESLLHWAVSHGRFELIQKCLRYRRKALFWRTGGEATWLHVAAQYGHSGIINNLFSKIDAAKEASGGITALNVAAAHSHLDTVRALLEIIARDSSNADEASCAKARAIIHWNGRRESPLTLSISRKHKRLEELFFSELKALADVSGNALDSIKESELLEILAEWEKPGRESLLKHLLQHWLAAPSNTDFRYWSALHWAVHGSAAVVVWWLLSKGGYRSGDAIRDCQKDPLAKVDAIGQIIQNLLRNPPPQMYEIANPVDDERPFPPRPMDWEDQRPDLHGFILNVYSQNGKIVVPYTRDTLHGIIYSQGPTALSRQVEMLEQRDLNILKKKLGNVWSEGQSLPNIWNRSRTLSGGVRSTVTPRRLRHDYSDSSENLKLRWIHLPVNELQLTKVRQPASPVSDRS
jgi:ankyrin repeat protein